jgi:hypothetical protein
MSDDRVLTDEARHAVTKAIEEGRKIEAIKLYREATGSDLAEAKRQVEQMIAQLPSGAPKPIGPSSGCLGVVAGALALGAAWWWVA